VLHDVSRSRRGPATLAVIASVARQQASELTSACTCINCAINPVRPDWWLASMLAQLSPWKYS